ncbi:MAG: MogA/MoaB family molybdenum cofactor biosynthesis protein [Chloroflexi bacterium]|nr:MogA/MoaB family molybdenum cofactor biosynthesis protein [Chloroflexota bacterium]
MKIRVAVITISDRAFSGEREDQSGPRLISFSETHGWSIVCSSIIPDEFEEITKTLLLNANSGGVDLILTTGGTGFSRRDVTPEATLSILQKRTPGLVEKMRLDCSKINPNAILSRSESGIIGKCLIINLPGNPNAAEENLSCISPVLEHAISIIQESEDSQKDHSYHL